MSVFTRSKHTPVSHPSQHELLNCVESGKRNEFVSILKNGGNGNLILHHLIFKQDIVFMNLLLEHAKDLKLSASKLDTPIIPLFGDARKGNEQKPPPAFSAPGSTSLFGGHMGGNKRKLPSLFGPPEPEKKKVPLGVPAPMLGLGKGTEKQSPLYLAIAYTSPEMVRLLRAKGATMTSKEISDIVTEENQQAYRNLVEGFADSFDDLTEWFSLAAQLPKHLIPLLEFCLLNHGLQ